VEAFAQKWKAKAKVTTLASDYLCLRMLVNGQKRGIPGGSPSFGRILLFSVEYFLVSALQKNAFKKIRFVDAVVQQHFISAFPALRSLALLLLYLPY
jgi:hypothetical protein